MWDDACEEKARELMRGFINAKDAPQLEEQQAVANWLNQMMPYPGWRFRCSDSGRYWVAGNDLSGAILNGVSEDNEYSHGSSQKKSYRLLELITQLEMGL